LTSHRVQQRWLPFSLALSLLIIAILFALPSQQAHAAGRTFYAFMPLIQTAPAPPAPPLRCDLNQNYGTLSIEGSPTDRPAEIHADLNLSMRGYDPTDAARNLVDYGGGTDAGAPQLFGLFGDNRVPRFSAMYRVYNWDWGCNCRASLNQSWPATLAGMATDSGEPLHLPDRGNGTGDIGFGYKALVLYANDNRITLKYTREDNVIYGYTIHVEGVCVEPDLLALYRQMDAQGRSHLPALYPGQPFGVARASEIGVAIRDTGSFMDPRSRKDWWAGR
jgi:hypothetical protein